jgi:phosphoglycerol transferase MdoB-like AlkP superfamily enzyme
MLVTLLPDSRPRQLALSWWNLAARLARPSVLREIGSLSLTFAIAMLLVIVVEWISRGSFSDIADYLTSPIKPGLTTIGLIMLVMLVIDSAIGRVHQSLLLIAPLAIIPAFVSSQKQHYLSDPLYPSDFLFGRQIMGLMPVIVRDRPFSAAAVGVGAVASIFGIVLLWRFASRYTARLSQRSRVTRLSIGLPLFAIFVSQMDPFQYSYIREKLRIIPIVWDQKENYSYNGFILAFALNLPMAEVRTPQGYGASAIEAIPARNYGYLAGPREKPDVIMLMSESFWDPTRIANLKFTPDPLPNIRAAQSGNVFSPEFGGMTANVEFEALTGFSNAFLPYGSIPYQQYVRRQIPSLATFFRGEGYAARALHPFSGWFWNRNEVYRDFGFEEFRTEETLPPLEKRGMFASDESLMKEIMHEGEEEERPFFFFAVTLQGHGPYEPHRYENNVTDIQGNLTDADRETLATYTQGVKEADASLKLLMDWASKRQRETIIVLWGDHLPPLGTVYPDTSYMPEQVATRKAPLDIMKREHETPLVIWSSKKGVRKDVGTLSPALIPYNVLKTAGFEHPFYTGFLGRVQKKYNIIDRYQLATRDNQTFPDWLLKDKGLDPLVRDYRYLQHDMMFGKEYGLQRFFPTHAWLTGQGT